MRHSGLFLLWLILNFPPFHPFPPYFAISASQMKSPEKKKARKSTTQVGVVLGNGIILLHDEY